jgi:hypothetical protein
MCSTKALLGGDGDVVADIFRTRVLTRGKGSEVWGWGTAYGKPRAVAPSPSRRERSHEALDAGLRVWSAWALAACTDKPQESAGGTKHRQCPAWQGTGTPSRPPAGRPVTPQLGTSRCRRAAQGQNEYARTARALNLPRNP